MCCSASCYIVNKRELGGYIERCYKRFLPALLFAGSLVWTV
jgi:hypothetical protein